MCVYMYVFSLCIYLLIYLFIFLFIISFKLLKLNESIRPKRNHLDT